METFKVESLTRFLFAPTGRIYDPTDVFEVTNKADFDYLVNNKLCKEAKKDAEITETDQDRRDNIAKEAAEKEKEIKSEVGKVIEEKFTEKESKPVNKRRPKIKK